MFRIDHLFEFSLFHTHVVNLRFSQSNLSIEEPALNLFIYPEFDEDVYDDRLISISSWDASMMDNTLLVSTCMRSVDMFQ